MTKRQPILLAAIAVALYFLAGCAVRPGSAAHYGPPSPAAVGVEETASAKVGRLEGELRQAKLARDEARLSGARTLLNWSTGILALCTVGGIVAAVFMRSRLLAFGAVACAVGAASAQVFQQALDHIALISWLTLIAAAVTGGWMIWRYHRD